MRTLRLVLAAQLVPAALLVVACGSSNPSSSMSEAQTAATTTNTWVVPDTAAALDAASTAAFTAGTLYVNAHTTANPNGEIRGQLDVPGDMRLAALDGAQEAPPTTTQGFGAGVLTVDPATGKVRGFVVTNGLVSATGALVQDGARTTAGGTVLALTGGPDVWVVPDNAAPLTVVQMADFVAGHLYFNVSTAANPNGEIRGQLERSGTVRLASLDGAQETPPTTSKGFGVGVLAVDVTGKVAGFIQTSGVVSPTAANVYLGPRGTPGSKVVPLTGGAPAAPTAAPATAPIPATGLWVVPDNAAAITPAQIAAFGVDGLYYNVLTAANPNGEIWGQLDKKGTARVAALDGAQETPPVTTTAFGASLIVVDATSSKVSGLLVTSGLVSPTVAHIHSGARAVPGGIIVPLSGP
jgi:hypothetical protein